MKIPTLLWGKGTVAKIVSAGKLLSQNGELVLQSFCQVFQFENLFDQEINGIKVMVCLTYH